VVALCLPRGVDLVVALLAVLKSGAAYLPLDPAYPAERLQFMLDDAQPACVLTTSAVAVRLPLSVPLIGLDTPTTSACLRQQPTLNLYDQERVTPLLPDHSAYIIYTSGSTGRPKGVVVTHGSLSNLFFCHLTERFTPARQANENQPLRIGHTASFAFDASWDPLLWLLDGHELHVVDEETSRDPQALVEYIATQRIDYLDCTPSFMQQLIACGLFADERRKPQIVVVGGEATSESLWNELTAIAGTTSYNLYGPTEYTVDAYLWQADLEQPLVGHAIANTRLYLLDEQGELVPPGVVGELWIAGAGLARGYLNRPDLTAERFQPDLFGAPGTRRYRTGDLARWRRDGTLDFLGRADAQVKVRGFRIELGEIEAVLRRQPQVAQAAVLVREDRPGDQRLVAYVVEKNREPRTQNQELAPEQRTKNQEQTDTELPPSPAAAGEGGAGDEGQDQALSHQLLTSLRQQLPEYMVPTAIVVLQALPLTRNGKLDRKALPAPELERSAGRGPRTPREAILCEIMGEVLGVAQVGIDDSFFELGGHSLLAAQLVARVRAALDVELRIGTLFEAPSVAALAERLDDGQAVRPPLRAVVRPDPTPFSFAQRRLWFLSRLEGASSTYNLPLVLHLSGELDRRALAGALGDLVARHESLRTIFPDTRGVPQQVLLDADVARPALTCVEICAADLDAALRDAARYSFDLTAELPLRAQLFAVDPHTHVLLVLLHHIAGDGASLAPLARDLATAYAARCGGATPAWPDLPVQYADYALWQHEILGSESDPDSLIAQQLNFWRDTLQELPDQLDLPTDHPRPSVASYCGDTVAVAIAPELHGRLLMLARESGTTVFMVLQSALAALLTRLGAGTDIPLGALVAGRSDAALHDLIGFFVNTLVLRTDTSNNPSFRDLLRRVRDTDLAAFAHQELPFERLVEAINPTRSLARHPLFQVLFVFQNTASAVLDMPGLTASLEPLHIGAAKFDLSLNLDERRSADGTPLGIRGFIEYSTDLFERATVVAIAARLLRLLSAVVADPEQPIGQIEILTAEERQRLLETWNPTIEPQPATTITALFEAQVARTPQAIALNDPEVRLSYAELNARANRLARLLRTQGVGPEQVVALCLPRGVDLVVALLAVLKSGA
ncbi:MAG: amino acid adenylation domain-containing protein, partial [Chloroflexi bacterium]|nr:amino acid adenylation domain-containing protein [Chloroflexota bacterium]